MATCRDIVGTWDSLLVFDPVPPATEEEVEDDGELEIFGDMKTGEHRKANGDTTSLEVDCKDIGRGRLRLTITEVDGRTTTVRSGKVILVRGTLFVIKGRVRRRTEGGRRLIDNGDGDWSTEKPT